MEWNSAIGLLSRGAGALERMIDGDAPILVVVEERGDEKSRIGLVVSSSDGDDSL